MIGPKNGEIMTKNSTLLLALLMASSPMTVNAQASSLNILAGTGRSGNVFGQAGDINLTSYDKNQLEAMLVKHFQSNQKEDREYVESLVKEIESRIGSILEEAYRPNGLREMSDLSLSSRRIAFLDYLGATRSFENMIAQARLRIQGLLSIPSSLRGSQNVTINGQTRTEIPAALKVDLTAVQNHYNGELSKLVGILSKLTFLLDIGGVPTQVQGISFRPEKIPFNPAELAIMREEAVKDLAYAKVGVESRIDEFNLYARRQLLASIRVFGQSQRYRLQLNQEGRDQNLENLEEIFWARSYLRAMYGEKIGTFAVDYKKQQINWDFFSSRNNIQLMAEFIRNDSELMDYQDKLANALVTQTSRSREILSRETSLLDRLMSTITFVRGEAPLTAINTAILKLIMGDIQEEMMLSKGGGLREMRAQYRARFYKDEASEKRVRARAADYRGGATTDIEADNLSTNTGTLRGAFKAASLALDGVIDRLEQANQRLRAIEELRAQSESANRVRERGNI